MIKLGMTDCPPVRRLLDGGDLQLDYLEVHGPFAAQARQAYPQMPMLLHNALYQWSLTHADGLQHQNALALTQQRLALTASPWYSLHLGFSAEVVDFVDEAMVALSPVQDAQVIKARTAAALIALKHSLPVPLLVENLDFNPTGAYDVVCEPDFIHQMVEESGVFLLLDLAHARVSAAALNLPVQNYLAELPLHAVRQIHINRPGEKNSRLWDAHEALQDDDYHLLQWVLPRCQPWALTLEYNRDAAKICQQVAQLRTCLQQLD